MIRLRRWAAVIFGDQRGRYSTFSSCLKFNCVILLRNSQNLPERENIGLSLTFSSSILSLGSFKLNSRKMLPMESRPLVIISVNPFLSHKHRCDIIVIEIDTFVIYNILVTVSSQKCNQNQAYDFYRHLYREWSWIIRYVIAILMMYVIFYYVTYLLHHSFTIPI